MSIAHETPRPAPSRAAWGESLVIIIPAACLVGLLSKRAFSSYFFAEAFVYLGSYVRAGDSFWGAVFSPHGHYFFRPALWALNLPWNLYLPPEPLAYHIRNFVFIFVNLLLFERVARRMVRARTAIAIGILYIAVSKVHVTTIGYVATFSTILVLMLTLLSMLFFLRYMEEKRWIDYALTLVFVTLSVFSKDYGVAVLPVLGALAFWRSDAFRARWRSLFVWAVPVAIIVVSYAAIRSTIVTSLPPEGSYVPSLSFEVLGRKSLIAVSTLANLTFYKPEFMGASGVADLLRSGRRSVIVVGAILFAAFLIMVLTIVVKGRRAGRLLLVPVVWALTFTVPTFVSSNEQIYYFNDTVAATGLLMAVCLDQLERRWREVWLLIVLCLGINTAVSNRLSGYTWEYVADKVAPIAHVAKHFRGDRFDRVLFIVEQKPFWDFALTADSLGAMVPALFGDRHLEVFVLTRADQNLPALSEGHTLIIEPENGFRPVWPKAER